MTVFDLEHIFIVFAPGAGGNFISGLLDNLITNKLSQLDISSTGSSHTLMAKKAGSQDHISLGTFTSERKNFESDSHRIEYYTSKILDIDSPQIVWTHDYQNINDYSNLFPNSKILVITAETEQERLAVTFMYCVKNMLDEHVATPHPEKRLHVWKYWNWLLKTELSTLIPEHKVSEALADTDIIKYLHIDRMMKTFRIMNYCNLPEPTKESTLNLNPYDMDKYLNDRCIILPYRYLVENDVETLVDVISKLLTVDESRKNYIVKMFDYYRNKQHLPMLEDPLTFLEQLKTTFDEKIKTFNL